VTEAANLTDAFTREACDFIARHKSQPFFLCLTYNAVHSPLQAGDLWLEKFRHIPDIQRRIFAAMLAHLDHGIGRVMLSLKEAGVHENTLVVFLSDNGGPTKELTSSNAPLRGGKGDLWEGGIRVPFIVSWPGTVPGGRVIDTPVLSPDAVVTALSLAQSAFDVSKFDGRDLRPLLMDKSAASPHDALFWRVGRKHALRQGDWKLIREGRAWRLYNLATDLAETTDLAKAHPDRVQDLSSRWDEWNAAQMDPRW
jgi:arylsulfatase B